MRTSLRYEWLRLRRTFRLLDRQTTFILVATAVLLVVQFHVGDRSFFRAHISGHVPQAWQGLGSWGWWFGFQGLTGFVLPALSLRVLFGRTAAQMGLGRGDWKLATRLALAYLPLVVVGTWFLSDGPAFQAAYPHFTPAATDWRVFVAYEALFVFYWIGWEYLWRGFVLFGTAPSFGAYAIFVQMLPFAVMHLQKPTAEAILSVVGGLALGVLVWRCRSFWIAVPIHAAQMLVLDLWCALRIRTGVQGTGLDALAALLHALGR